MARYKESYSLYSRKTKTGKKVFYYRTYDPDGTRTSGKSTGCINKSAARQYCENLLKTGRLYDGSAKTFGVFAEGFFGENNVWYQEKVDLQEAANKISESYVSSQKTNLKNHLMPYFRNIKLQNITPILIKQFRIYLGQEKRLTAPTINLICGTLRIIISEADDNNIITNDPFKKYKPLPDEKKQKRKAFSLDEVNKIVNFDYKNDLANLFFLTAAVTGMRKSEVMAIREETLEPQYIIVKDQFVRNKYQPTKSKKERKVPIPEGIYKSLYKSIAISQDANKRAFILSPSSLANLLFESTESMENKKERKLCIHSFRHFCNTYFLSENISSVKVAAVIGHSSRDNAMQERYTSWTPEMMPEIYEAQEKLFKLLLS